MNNNHQPHKEICIVNHTISFWHDNHFYFLEPKEKTVSPVIISIIKQRPYLFRNVTIKSINNQHE